MGISNSSKVSIIVPTYSQHSKLRRLLRSFDNLKDLLPYEIIVVDDCSPDDTPMVVKNWMNQEHSFRTQYVRLSENGGPAKARNAGLKIAIGEIVAFTDSDCVVDKFWLRELVTDLDVKAKIIGVGGKVKPLNGGIFSKYYTYHKVLEPPPSLFYLVTANCCFMRDTVLAVNGFDEYISKPGGEDVSLCIRLYKNGWGFSYTPEAIVFHDYRNSLRDFIKTFRNYGEGSLYATKTTLEDTLGTHNSFNTSSAKGSTRDSNTLRPRIFTPKQVFGYLFWYFKTYRRANLKLYDIVTFSFLRIVQITAYTQGWNYGEKVYKDNDKNR